MFESLHNLQAVKLQGLYWHVGAEIVHIRLLLNRPGQFWNEI